MASETHGNLLADEPELSSPVRWDPDRVREHMRKGVEAWNARDADRVLALVTEDIVWEDPSIPGGRLRGKQAARQWMESLWRASPDLTWEMVGEPFVSLDGGRLGCVWRVWGHMTGPLDPPGWEPSGASFELMGFDFIEFEGDLVSHETSFSDQAGLARQIGVLPKQGSRAERVTVLLQRAAARARRRARIGSR